MTAIATGETGIKRSAKLIDNTVFDAFKTLTSETETERFDGSLSLLRHLNRRQDAEKHAKERDYTLTRLVRGLGASTLASRAGYFTTLVGFLSGPANADITHDQIVAVLEKQLHVGKAVADKEDSDALIGHILLVGALMRSNRLAGASNAEITQCAEILVRAAGNKVFHASMAYKFLVDLLQELNAEQFNAALWPAMRKELSRPWERHTCNTVHFLMVAQDKYPEVVDAAFLQKTLKTGEILSPLAHKHLGRIFWGNTSLAAITHPAYEALSKFLLSVKRKQLLAFWTGEISETLAAPNKIKEVVTVKLLTDFLTETAAPLDSKSLLKLLTPRVIRMFVSSLKALKVQKHDVLVSFYEEFFDALHTYFGSAALATDDAGRVAILQRFVVHPGTLLIEKYLPQKTIHQLITKLGADGIRPLFDMYRAVFLGSLPKDPEHPTSGWQNVERQHAAQMMQYLLAQKCVQADLVWRSEQLNFLLTVGLFHVNDDGSEVVRKDQAAAQPNITKELSATARNLFYASLQMRLPQLRDEKQVLVAVVERAHQLVTRKQAAKMLRAGAEWTPETAAAWQQMYDVLQAGKNEKTLTLVFQILFLHMGLQLFREPEMARVAIADLVQCMEKTKNVKRAQKKARKSLDAKQGAVEEEPEWIEVVVDLFLHLLSQNTSFLRNVVSNVFPQLCGEMTLTAVHQVLAMLDMKDGKNPLSAAKDGAEEEDEADDDDEDEDEKDSDEEDDEETKSNDGESDGDDDDDDDADDDEDEEDDVMEEDEGTVSDQLRNAVSTALGALLPSASVADDDNDSVDLNDMDDAEAARLDVALSAAFQSIRKSGAGSTSTKSKKKTKSERTTNTTVMHFRIRVLDLIDIYLRTAPALSISLEILLALFNMIEYCADSDLQPLADKVDRTLKRLLALRQFSSVDDVTAVQLCDLLRSLVAKKVNPVKLSAHNQLLSKTAAFVIAAAQQLTGENAGADADIQALIGEYAAEFIRSRNPGAPFSLLQDTFRVRWLGVWHIGLAVAEQALAPGAAVRQFRRTQALELLALLYRNHGFIVAEADTFNGLNAHIERTLAAYVARFAAAAAGPAMSGKEFEALVVVLAELHRCHQLQPVRAVLKWSTVGEQVQSIRARVQLASVGLRPYKRFCQALKLTVLRNPATSESVTTAKAQTNGTHEDSDEDADEEETKPAAKTAKKRKSSDQAADSKREKKLKKAERLRIASEGLNDLSFSAARETAGSGDEAEMTEDSD